MEIKFRPGEERDFDELFKLCEKRFGEGYITHDEFEKWLTYGKLFLVAECENKFCGYSLMEPVTDEEIADYMHLTLEEVREHSGGKQSVHYRSAALKEGFEGNGIMRKMTEIGLSNVKEMGCSQVFGPAWKYDGKIPMHKLLTSFGFEPIAEKENIWLDQEGYTCIVCNGRCKCQCVIYRKIFQ